MHSTVRGLLLPLSGEGCVLSCFKAQMDCSNHQCWEVSFPISLARDWSRIGSSLIANLMSLGCNRVYKAGILVVCVVTWYIVVVCCCYIIFIIRFSQKFGKAFHQAQILESWRVISCLYVAQNIVTFSLKQMTMSLLVNKED